MTTLPTCWQCGVPFDPKSVDDRHNHRIKFGHPPVARPRKE